MDKTAIDAASKLVSHAGLFGLTGAADMLARFGINLVVVFILVYLIYYKRHKNKDFLFTFFLFNIVIFLICYLLSSNALSMGFAFGLFAIFSILRYRTVSVPIREMGYFFACITVGLVNALDQPDNGGIEMFAADGIILLVIFILERQHSLQHENYKEISYERIELIKPEKREEMLQDLRNRTGLPIHRVEINRIDFLRDVARIKAFYLSHENETNAAVEMDNDD